MRIKLAARGGFAAGIPRPERQLDSKTLEPGEAARLARAVEAAIAESSSLKQGGAAPDAMSYTVTVEDGGAPTTLKAGDADMPPRFADLLDQLERLLPR